MNHQFTKNQLKPIENLRELLDGFKLNRWIQILSGKPVSPEESSQDKTDEIIALTIIMEDLNSKGIGEDVDGILIFILVYLNNPSDLQVISLIWQIVEYFCIDCISPNRNKKEAQDYLLRWCFNATKQNSIQEWQNGEILYSLLSHYCTNIPSKTNDLITLVLDFSYQVLDIPVFCILIV